MNFDEISFHESTVENLFTIGKSIQLELSGVIINKQDMSVLIDLSGVIGVTIDGFTTDGIGMVYQDGEILHLSRVENLVEMIVEWHDFLNSKAMTVAYKIICDRVELKIK